MYIDMHIILLYAWKEHIKLIVILTLHNYISALCVGYDTASLSTLTHVEKAAEIRKYVF